MTMNNNIDRKRLLAENAELRARLDEAEETLRAIRSGEVDALVVSGAGGELIYTLKGADLPYRMLIEEMSEGALTLTAQGVIVYANRCFAEMLKIPLEQLIGATLDLWLDPDSRPVLEALLSPGAEKNRRAQLELTSSDGSRMPVSVSASRLPIDGMPDTFCLVATDLTEQQRSAAIAAAEKLAQELLTSSNQSRRELLSVIEDQKQAEQKTLATSNLHKHALEDAIGAIAATLEQRDPYTAGHQRRVAELAAAIGTEMGLAANTIEGIHFGGLIHDIGKISVPAEILGKPGRLSDVEFGLIKAHAEAGYEIVKEIAFPWPVADMVRQHHERMDGSGYPHGLKGEHIIQEARVLAVADVVEAMSANRPYRPGFGMDAALGEIIRGRVSQFDPAAVDACLRIIKEKGFVFTK